MNTGSLYSDAEIEKIAGWLKEGFSASKIAGLFSREYRHKTRNAIIGVVHRNKVLKAIGFVNPGPAKAVPGSPRVTRVPRAPKPAAIREHHRQRFVDPSHLPNRLKLAMTMQFDESRAYQTLALRVAVPPPRARAPEPQRVGMRFIDCLFDRCRMPIDLSTGGPSGRDMLCCGLPLDRDERFGRDGEERGFCRSCRSVLNSYARAA